MSVSGDPGAANDLEPIGGPLRNRCAARLFGNGLLPAALLAR
jgi:hypothetical protein